MEVRDVNGVVDQRPLAWDVLEGMWSQKLQIKREEAIKTANGSSKWHFLDYNVM